MNVPSIKKIGFVCWADPFSDKKAWSGTFFNLRSAIENAGFEVVWIPVRPNTVVLNYWKRFLYKFAHNAIFEHTFIYVYLCARSINRKLIDSVDCLFFPGGAQMLYFLRGIRRKPTIYLADATFHQMIDYYWHDLPKWIIRSGERLEKVAIRKSSVRIYSSDWARESACCHYKAVADSTYVLEFGANLSTSNIKSCKPYKIGEELRIMFSGVEWERKGADIAIDTARLLNESGIPTKLLLTGIQPGKVPEGYCGLDFVEYVGFLNKNEPSEESVYAGYLAWAHCFLLPSKAECSATVLSEAASFGLPAFTYDTGGLSNYVINGNNGYRLPIESGPSAFSSKIAQCIVHDKLGELRKGALAISESKLNWSTWSKSFVRIISKL